MYKENNLWRQFLTIAQPFWFSDTENLFAFLSFFLGFILFCLTVFFVSTSALFIVGTHYFPEIFAHLTPDWDKLIFNIINSPAIHLIRIFIIVPIVCCIYFWQQIKYHWRSWCSLAVMTWLLLSVSIMSIVSSYVGRDLVTAIAQKHSHKYLLLLFIYGGVFIITTPIEVFSKYVRQKLGLYWLRWLTNYFLNKYFHNRAYYQINFHPDIDNPDQRISQDISSFIQTSLNLFLVTFNQIIDLIAFGSILWSISKSLVAVLIGYAVVGNLTILWFSQHLIHLNHNQLRCEGDFRYGLIHIRNHAESIAFYQGEVQESTLIKRRFTEAIQNSNKIIGWQRNLEFFTTAYNYFLLILPYLLVAPLYLNGQVELGVITQASIACNQVLGALSVIVNQFESLSIYAAVINRLNTFLLALETTAQQASTNKIALVIQKHLDLKHLTLQTPNYERILVNDLSVSVADGKGLLIIGNSGCGKSSLLRAIAGLWKTGKGVILRPNLKEMLFLPQRPYMILGSLREQLLYPNISRQITDKELYEILQQVNLQNLPTRVGGLDTELDWENILSLGEQQRLAFARLLLMQPRYAILDEATSALDLNNEEHLYQQLQATNITFISVGHRQSLFKYHHQILELSGDSSWRVVSAMQALH